MRIKNKHSLRISPTDQQDGFLINKIKSGENVSVSLEGSSFGEQLVISANKTQGRTVRVLTSSQVINADDYLVLVDASKEHVVVTLPPASDFIGQISIVCLDPSYGIEIQPNHSTSNLIFDSSNASFKSRGDSITLISDKGFSKEQLLTVSEDESDDSEFVSMLNYDDNGIEPGTWYIISKYFASWYA